MKAIFNSKLKKMMMIMMDGRSKKIHQRTCKKNKSRFNNSNKNMDSKHSRISVTPRLKETTKKFTKRSKRNLPKKPRAKTKQIIKLSKQVLSRNGPLLNGLRNGRKRSSCQTSKHASLIHMAKQCHSETN